MKSRLKWVVIGLVVVLLVLGLLRILSSRQAQKDALQAQQTALTTAPIMTLSDADLVQVNTIDLVHGLAISGPIKAVNSAWVKARVAGELQGLTVREGDEVKAGQLIARVDATEFQARVRQARQQAGAAQAQVSIAQRNFDNNRALVAQGFISDTALTSSLATLAAAEATFQAAQAGVDVATKSVQDAVLRAPISGYIAQRLAQTGERVAIEARVVEIVDLRHLELEASVSAADSLTVKVGQKAQLTLEGATQTLTAQVVRVNPSVVEGSRAVRIYLAIQSSADLRQGLFAQGALQTGQSRTLAAPLSAVRTDQPLPYVQQVSNGQVLHRTVTPGVRGIFNGETMVGLQGVNEGDLILSGTVGLLRAGTLVQTPGGAQ